MPGVLTAFQSMNSSNRIGTVPYARRLALSSLTPANLNLASPSDENANAPLSSKRKKEREEDDPNETATYQKEQSLDSGKEGVSGCGRMVCRNCCEENYQQCVSLSALISTCFNHSFYSRNTVTCSDCRGP